MTENSPAGFFEQKFELWNKKLLDLSRRNRLLNYKKRKTGSFELEGKIEELFLELVEGKGFSFDVKPDLENPEENDLIRERARKLEYIRKQIKLANDEMGFNIGYAAFGLLNWSENDRDFKDLQSPLVLVPIEIQTGNLFSEVEVNLKVDEELALNPVIIKKLSDDFGIVLDEDYEITNINEALSYVQSKVSDYGWTISEEVIIDTFNFQNLVIQKDLEMNKELVRNNPFIKALAQEKDEKVEKLFDEYNHEIDLKKEDSKTRLQILDADSSQQEAISRARRGDSFVLQGPPGTGKSQTISNIIAEQLGLGKKVLFVSEKQAALEVVYHKLKEKGLSEFLLTLHNTKQRKGDIRNQLQNSLDLSSKSYSFKDENLSLYTNLNNETQMLNAYDDLVHNENNPIHRSFYDLHGKLAKVLHEQDLFFNVEESILSLPYEQMKLIFQKVGELGKMYIDSSFRHKENGWQHFKGDLTFTKTTEISKLFEDLKSENTLISDLSYKIKEIFPHQLELRELKSFIENFYSLLSAKEGMVKSDWLTLDLVELSSSVTAISDLRAEKQSLLEEILTKESEIKSVFEEEFLKTENVDQLTKILKYEYKFLPKRLFSSKYKEIFKKNKLLTKELKLNYRELVENVEKLSNLNAKNQLVEKISSDLISKEDLFSLQFGLIGEVSDHEVSELGKGLSWLKDIKLLCYKEEASWLIALESLKRWVDADEKVDWTRLNQLLSESIEANQKLQQLIDNFGKNFSGLPDEIDAILCYIEKLDFNAKDEYFSYRRAKSSLLENYQLESFVEEVESTEIPADKVEAVFIKRFLLLALENNPDYSKISNLSTKEIANRISDFKKADKTTFSLARDRIFKELVDRLPNINENIKVTSREISVLKKELTKKSRLMPTRKLIQNLPTLLPRLKPCIMMSPITVSTYFAANSEWNFDLVIFDEASQVKPEYAVAAISRGKQIIVAGDSKQMPPTSFFDSSAENEEDDENDVQDLESILDELSVKIPETYLNWHYRSKDESLISFSNKKFYNNRLFTFPTDNMDIHSNVRFTYVENGLWESKSGNAIEADRVAKLVHDFAKNSPEKSLGIVAFGMNQARMIEDKITELRVNHPEIESFFDENKSEAFFVKNLENVQGDERDIIILSVGYGKSPNGKIRMNFGPLTQSGGERRLNVAVSRAREIMQVVSSMKSSDITLEGNTNENRVVFRDFLEFAEKGVSALIGYDVVDEERAPEFDSDFEENVYDYLINKGYKVHTQVGSSDYRIDMAVIHPKIPGRYVIAIECDGATYHSSRTARDRDRLRQEILEAKGWNFYRIWSTTWIHDNENEKSKLIETIDNAILHYSEDKKTDDKSDEVGEEFSNLIAENEVEISLPHLSGDVYYFRNNISGLAEIIFPVAKAFVGYETLDLMKYINKEVFAKTRLTEGYKEIYSQAFSELKSTGKIEVSEGTGQIISVR